MIHALHTPLLLYIGPNECDPNEIQQLITIYRLSKLKSLNICLFKRFHLVSSVLPAWLILLTQKNIYTERGRERDWIYYMTEGAGRVWIV